MELINSVPQPTATTFAFPSVWFLFYVSTVQYCITIFSLSTYDDLSCPPPSSVESRSSYGADLADKEILDLLLHNKRYDKRIKPPAPGPLRYTSHTPRFFCLFYSIPKLGTQQYYRDNVTMFLLQLVYFRLGYSNVDTETLTFVCIFSCP